MVKRFLSVLLSLIMVAGLLTATAISANAEGKYTGTGTFVQCNGALKSGYYVFGVGTIDGSIAALSTATISSNWIKYTTTMSASGRIVNPDTSTVWYYDAEAGTFKNDTNYVAWPTSGNSAGLKTTGTPLTVTETATAGVYNIAVTATPARMLRLNGTSGYRFYTSVTGTNTFYFFKLVDEQSSSTQIVTHSVTGKANNAGTGYEYNYAFKMTSPKAINGTFIVALYDGQNKLVGVKAIPLSDGKTSYTETSTEPILTLSEATTYKIMFWSGLDTLRPLCIAESNRINR